MRSRQSRLQEDTYFKVMDLLEKNPELSQRQLAKSLGISLGGVNYCLNALVDKGWVKIQNFHKNDNKLTYMYLLTPKGIVSKAKLTKDFLRRKLEEYEVLKYEIKMLKASIETNKSNQIEVD